MRFISLVRWLDKNYKWTGGQCKTFPKLALSGWQIADKPVKLCSIVTSCESDRTTSFGHSHMSVRPKRPTDNVHLYCIVIDLRENVNCDAELMPGERDIWSRALGMDQSNWSDSRYQHTAETKTDSSWIPVKTLVASKPQLTAVYKLRSHHASYARILPRKIQTECATVRISSFHALTRI